MERDELPGSVRSDPETVRTLAMVCHLLFHD